jgi:hypothetical protein
LFDRHRTIEPKLNRIWYNALAPRLTGNVVWRELVRPCRQVWAGLACAWVLIIAVHLASSEPAARVDGKTAPPSRDEMQAMVEQRRMLAQLIGPSPEPAVHRKAVAPGPRSERPGRVEAA